MSDAGGPPTRTLFAADLDRTLIYSINACRGGADPVATTCVERYEDKPASFMTLASAALLAEVRCGGEFVPVTTRTTEQYRRVLLPGGRPRYAVTTNGGALLVDGLPDRAWSLQVAALLRETAPLREVWDHVVRACRPEFTDKVRNAADLFCYAIVHRERLPGEFVAQASGWAAERGWRTSLQGRKLYWVPEGLTKSCAVAEVARRAGCERLVAAGDSFLDADLLLAADAGIYPRHGELYEQGWSAPNVGVTAASGITAGEEILHWFLHAAAVNKK